MDGSIGWTDALTQIERRAAEVNAPLGAQEVAAKTALLIFDAMLVAGVAASAGILLRRPETDTGAKP